MKLQYEILLPEFMEMAWIRHRSSARWIIGLCVGAIGLGIGLVFYFNLDRIAGLFLIIASAVLLLMQLAIPTLVYRRVYRRNSRMFGPRTIIVTDDGIASEHPLGHSESPWSAYLKFQETQRSFLLHQSADLIGILPKRAFAGTTELQEFKALLTAKVPQS